MEIKNTSSNVNDLHSPSNYDDIFLKHSLLFADGLKDLRNVKEQLYSAAEHFEDSYHKNDQKQMLLESLKEYISKSVIKTIDHLGSVTCKINKFLDEHVNNVSKTKLRVVCIEQRLRTCQEYANHSGLSQQKLMMQTLKYHKQYPLQDGCISEAVKEEKNSDVIPFSFTEAESHRKLEKRSRSISPLRLPIKRSVSAVNQSTCSSFYVKMSSSSVHRSISPNSSSNRQQQPLEGEASRSLTLYPQSQSKKNMKVYSKKSRSLLKALFSMYKSKKNIII